MTKSKPCFFPELPKPILSAKFTYNFFVNDEMISSAEDQDSLNRISRLIELRFDPKWSGNISKLEEGLTKEHINFDVNMNYITSNLQDLNLINEIIKKTSLTKPTLNYMFNKSYPSDVPINEDVIKKIMSTQNQLEIDFDNNQSTNDFEDINSNSTFSILKKESIKQLTLNSEFNFQNQFKGYLAKYKNTIPLQNNFVTPLISIPIPPTQQEGAELVGYLLNKYEVDVNGDLNFINKYLIPDGNVTFKKVLKILYGKTYAFSIQAIYNIKMLVTMVNTPTRVQLKNFLIATSPSNVEVIDCVESVPPPPPCDLDFYWDYSNKSLRINWVMPVNTQRDIKGFLIFKRSDVKYPFELIKMYDFNDCVGNSRIPLPDYLKNLSVVETINTDSGRPILNCIDKEFNSTKSVGIYSVVSYDAHGMYSNLSTQFKVSIDPINNKAKKTLISNSGAPLSYPNLNIRQDLFLDSAFIENSDSFKICFDPAAEIINVTGQATMTNNKLFQTYDEVSDTGKYVFTFLNVDVQSQEQVEVRIKDVRTTTWNEIRTPSIEYMAEANMEGRSY